MVAPLQASIRDPHTVEQHGLVVAADSMKPGCLQPVDNRGTVRTAIDQVTDGKQAIPVTVEIKLLQQPLQSRKAAMHITDDIVSPLPIAVDTLQAGIFH